MLVNLRQNLAQFQNGIATIGYYTMPFTFTIPSTAAPSVHLSTGSDTCRVKWGLTATLRDTPAGVLATITELEVNARPPIHVHKLHGESEQQVTRCCCVKQGMMGLAATLDRDVYAGEMPLGVELEINNQSSKIVNRVIVLLKQTIHLTARGHRASGQHTVLRVEIPEDIPPHTVVGWGSDNPSRHAAAILPALAVPSFQTKNATVEYCWEIEACTPAWFVSNPRITIPITIHVGAPILPRPAFTPAVPPQVYLPTYEDLYMPPPLEPRCAFLFPAFPLRPNSTSHSVPRPELWCCHARALVLPCPSVHLSLPDAHRTCCDSWHLWRPNPPLQDREPPSL